MKNQFKFNRVFSVLMLSSIVMSSVPALAMDGLLENGQPVALSQATQPVNEYSTAADLYANSGAVYARGDIAAGDALVSRGDAIAAGADAQLTTTTVTALGATLKTPISAHPGAMTARSSAMATRGDAMATRGDAIVAAADAQLPQVSAPAAKPSILDRLSYQAHPRVYNGAAIAGAAAVGAAGAYKLATAERTKKYLNLGKKTQVGAAIVGGLTGAAVADLAVGTGATQAAGSAIVATASKAGGAIATGARTAGTAIADSRLGKAVADSRIGRAMSDHPYATAGIVAGVVGAGVVGYKLYQRYRKPVAPVTGEQTVAVPAQPAAEQAVQAPAQQPAPAQPAVTKQPMSRKAKLIGAGAAVATGAAGVAVADLRYDAGLARGAVDGLGRLGGAIAQSMRDHSSQIATGAAFAAVVAAGCYGVYRHTRPSAVAARENKVELTKQEEAKAAVLATGKRHLNDLLELYTR